MSLPAARARDEKEPQPEVGTSLELFTGAGGLALGLHRAGFRHVALNEMNRWACQTLLENQQRLLAGSEEGHLPLIPSPIEDVDFSGLSGQVDLVAGGPPCQPFSLAGKALGDQDARNGFPELFRAVREVRPRAVLCESVLGLLRPSFKPYFEYIIRELRAPFLRRARGEEWYAHDVRLQRHLNRKPADPSTRYSVYVSPVNAADYGVAQHRRRVFIVAFRHDLGVRWTPPAPRFSSDALVVAKAAGEYWDSHNLPSRGSQLNAGLFPAGQQDKRWLTVRDKLAGLPEPGNYKEETPPYLHHVRWPGARSYPKHRPNRLDEPAKTIKAGVHGVAGGENVIQLDDGSIRYFTVREVARLMSFPDEWILAGPRSEQMRQLGNAVPPDLAQAFSQAISDALSSARARLA